MRTQIIFRKTIFVAVLLLCFVPQALAGSNSQDLKRETKLIKEQLQQMQKQMQKLQQQLETTEQKLDEARRNKIGIPRTSTT